MVHYRLTYWNGRGYAETARQIFAYAGVPFDDNRMVHPDDAQWPALKPKTPFGQVPILEVDGKILAQSQAINRYLAGKFGLAGENEWEAAQVDALNDSLWDMLQKLRDWHYEKDTEKKKQLLAKVGEECLNPSLERFEKLLAANGTGYFVGSKISWFDIAMADLVANWDDQSHDIYEYIKPHKQLHEFAARIRSHPNLKKWIETRPKTPF